MRYFHDTRNGYDKVSGCLTVFCDVSVENNWSDVLQSSWENPFSKVECYQQ